MLGMDKVKFRTSMPPVKSPKLDNNDLRERAEFALKFLEKAGFPDPNEEIDIAPLVDLEPGESIDINVTERKVAIEQAYSTISTYLGFFRIEK